MFNHVFSRISINISNFTFVDSYYQNLLTRNYKWLEIIMIIVVIIFSLLFKVKKKQSLDSLAKLITSSVYKVQMLDKFKKHFKLKRQN